MAEPRHAAAELWPRRPPRSEAPRVSRGWASLSRAGSGGVPWVSASWPDCAPGWQVPFSWLRQSPADFVGRAAEPAHEYALNWVFATRSSLHASLKPENAKRGSDVAPDRVEVASPRSRGRSHHLDEPSPILTIARTPP